jgi:tetratricopeptide (TPR) repeat protein
MKRIVIQLILIFFGTAINAQENLDTLWGIWNNKKLADTVRLRAISDITESIVRNSPDSALVSSQQQLVLAIESDYKGFQADAHYQQGRAYSYLGDYPKALESYRTSIRLFEQTNNLPRKALSLAYISGSYNYQDEFYLSIDYANQAIDIYDDIGDIQLRAGVSKVLANSYYKLGMYKKAIDAYERGIRDAEKVNDKLTIGFNLIGIAEMYLEQDEVTVAFKYIEKALSIYREINDKMGLGDVNLLIGRHYLKEGKFNEALEKFHQGLRLFEETNSEAGVGEMLYQIGVVYAQQEKFSIAMDYFDRAQAIAEKTNNQGYYTDLLVKKGTVFTSQGQFKDGISFCRLGLEIAINNNKPRSQLNACECLYGANKSLNNNKQALKYLEQILAINKTIQKQQLSKNLQSMEFARQNLRDSIAVVEAKRIEEARKLQELTSTKRRHALQYSGIFLFVFFLFIIIFFSSKFSLDQKIARGLIFFAFLLFFEFILVLLSPVVGSISKGEPAYMLFCNAVLAGLIIPIHAFFDKKLKTKIKRPNK